MLIISLVVFPFAKDFSNIIEIILKSCTNAVTVCISMLPAMCFFCGMLKIAQVSGLCRQISLVLTPILKKLFPNIPPEHPAISMMTLNIISNMLGMGNAATAFGISAMKELQTINPTKDTASAEMCTFIILNTCTVVLLPTNIIALRHANGSQNPGSVINLIIIVSILICSTGIISCKIFERMKSFNK